MHLIKHTISISAFFIFFMCLTGVSHAHIGCRIDHNSTTQYYEDPEDPGEVCSEPAANCVWYEVYPCFGVMVSCEVKICYAADEVTCDVYTMEIVDTGYCNLLPGQSDTREVYCTGNNNFNAYYCDETACPSCEEKAFNIGTLVGDKKSTWEQSGSTWVRTVAFECPPN